jgi:dUTP pyrophosphatase
MVIERERRREQAHTGALGGPPKRRFLGNQPCKHQMDKGPYTVGDVCASDPYDADSGLQEANAKLIAAAPDLLEALQYVAARLREIDGQIERMLFTKLSKSNGGNSMNYWKKLHPRASLERRSPGAQGVDLVACIDAPVTIMPEARTLIPLGVAIAAPSGALLILRSSAGVRGLALANGVGLIDADYRGEVKAAVTAWAGAITIHPGDRVAQLVALDGGEWEEVGELDDTERGDGGFGSTDLESGYSDCPVKGSG